jgi:CyaY protein
MNEAEFDQAAEEELNAIEEALSEFDPDELDFERAGGVLTLTFADDQKCVINSHRAAGQIWMAAQRTAWHFSPDGKGASLRWKTDKDELRATLTRVLSERMGRQVRLATVD